MSKPIVYITRKIREDLLKPYEQYVTFRMWEDKDKPVPKKVLYKEAKEATAILCLLTEQIDKSFLRTNNHLKIVANMAVGYDNIDIAAANDHRIVITNTPDVLTETTADLTFALLMATARRLIEASDYIRYDKWGDWSPFLLAGTDIHDKTIGIVGMGRIGEAVAKRAKGFNMDVLYHNRNRNEQAESATGATYVSFMELLERSDFVVSLVPLSVSTEKMFNEVVFAQMKRSAIFINASRGAVVDEHALYNALKNKTIQAAGLDVFEHEPISSNHPLTKLNNAVLLPHIGSATVATREKMITLCLENIIHVLHEKEPITRVT